MKVYVCEMRRWGADDTHHYIDGVFSSRAAAEGAGLAEEYYRGRKYDKHIVEFDLDAVVDKPAVNHAT